MSLLALDPAIAQLDPLIITSPVIRSGTTLLQRLLCSSPETLIYGEQCGLDLAFYLQVYSAKVPYYHLRKASNQRVLQQVKEGKVNDWIFDLMPDLDGYLSALSATTFAGLACCRDDARKAGRVHWGLKCPGWSPGLIQALRKALPQSRFICIYRNLLDCVKSAKAQRELRTLADVQTFCATWASNLAFTLSVAHDPAFLVLSYETLAGKPVETIARITQFTGIASVDATVMNHKINGRNNSQAYTQPAELCDEELRLVAEVAARFPVQPVG